MSEDRIVLQRHVANGWGRYETDGQRPEWIGAEPCGKATVLTIIHTVASRAGDPRAAEHRIEVARQLEVAACEDIDIVLLIGMQSIEKCREQSLEQVKGIVDGLRCITTIRVDGFRLDGPGKLHSTNVAIGVAGRMGADGLLLIDDDVELNPDCLPRLIAAFRASCGPRAVGARKIGRPHESPTGHLLYKLKQFTQPATNYPHACCMIVSTDVVAGGLSLHHHSDDGQICFRLLQPDRSDPLARLKLIDDATCRHVVGAGFRGTIARLRRMLHHHAICMADAPYPVARYYFQQMLFHGLWPLAPFDKQSGVASALAKMAVKGLYFLWFVVVTSKLALRGMLGRPIGGVAWTQHHGEAD